MKSVPERARIRNVTGGGLCRWCGSAGWVVVNIRPVSPKVRIGSKGKRFVTAPDRGGYEEMAPCPYCEAGFREEFPVPKAGNKNPTTPPWGEDGFWKDRSEATIIPLYESSELTYGDAPGWEPQKDVVKDLENLLA